MLSARADHSATSLRDGRALLAGGLVKNGQFLKTAELYDPSTGNFNATGEMSVGRVGQAAALLADGRVLIVGGWATSGPTDSAEAQVAGIATARVSGLPTFLIQPQINLRTRVT
jgi:hypothetical protein